MRTPVASTAPWAALREEAPAAYREFEFLEPLVLLPDIEVPFNDDANIWVYSGTVFRGPLLCTLHEPVSFNVFVRYHPAARQSGPREAPSRVAPDAIDQALAEHPWLTKEDFEVEREMRPQKRRREAARGSGGDKGGRGNDGGGS